jgi:D-aminopeptidase
VGVLVMSNFGVMSQLRVGGLPVGEVLAARYREIPRRGQTYGSIIAVVATDAPLNTHQLNRLAKRAALGIGRAGSTAHHGSGEIVLAFSTANKVPRVSRKMVYRMKILLDERVDPLYDATVDAIEEAILNALCMARDMDGANGNVCRALPLADVRELAAQWQEIAARHVAAGGKPKDRTKPPEMKRGEPNRPPERPPEPGAERVPGPATEAVPEPGAEPAPEPLAAGQGKSGKP